MAEYSGPRSGQRYSDSLRPVPQYGHQFAQKVPSCLGYPLPFPPRHPSIALPLECPMASLQGKGPDWHL